MPPPSIEPLGPITQTLPTHLNLPKSLNGSSTSPEEGTLVNHPQKAEGEEDNHLACQGHLQEEAEEAEEEEEGEHSHHPGKHLFMLLKSS